jgi:hypothetical protein
MSQLSSGIFMILILIIILLIIALKTIWDLFATSVTVGLWKNNSGNISTKKLLIWVGIMIVIFALFAMLS